MEMEPVPGYDYANWERGYGDFHMAPDLATMRVAAWAPSTAIVLYDLVDDVTHELVPVAPGRSSAVRSTGSLHWV